MRRDALDHLKHRHVRYGLAIGLLVAVIATTSWYAYMYLGDGRYDKTSTDYQVLQKTLERGEPGRLQERVDYHAELSSLYVALGDDEKALDQLLKADLYITDRTVASGSSVNIAIAKLYQKRGDTAKAREYITREITRVKTDQLASDNQEYIEYLQKRLAEL